MNSDATFHIGNGHAVCQDYCAAGMVGEQRPYAILSDGCSSSPDTDFGSRLLVKSLERNIGSVGKNSLDTPFTQALYYSLTMTELLNLDQSALDATLLSVNVDKTGEFTAVAFGDGAIALKDRDGVLRVFVINYDAGYPKYLTYQAMPDRKAAFDKLDNPRTVTCYTFYKDWQYEVENVTAKFDFNTDGTVFSGPVLEYEYAAVISDGLTSFMCHSNKETSKTSHPVPLTDLIPKLFDFKQFNGDFAQRRVNRFEKDATKLGWYHYDDLSMGVIHFGPF